MRKAIIEFRKDPTARSRTRGIPRTSPGRTSFVTERRFGFPDRTAAETELVKKIGAPPPLAEQVAEEVDYFFRPLPESVGYWLDKHAAAHWRRRLWRRYREYWRVSDSPPRLKTPLNDSPRHRSSVWFTTSEDHGG